MPLVIEELDSKSHDRVGFDCAVEPLNRYIRLRAGRHRSKGFALTAVLVDSHKGDPILG